MMNAARQMETRNVSARRARVRTTLLDVVNAVADIADGDDEVVAVVDGLFKSGRMKLVGEFTERDFRI